MESKPTAYSIQHSVFGISYLVFGLFLILTLFLNLKSLILPPTVFAQLEVSDVYDLADKDAVDGDIISYTDKGINRASSEYDNKIFGVVNLKPLVSFKRFDQTGTPISRSGTVEVNVTTANGAIKVGDYITSSTVAGKGEKAVNSGYVLGVALKPFSEGEGEQITITTPRGKKQISQGKITVAIRIEYAELNTARNANRLLDAINSAFFRSVQDPEKFVNIIRYLLAGAAVILSFIVGFFTFAKTIPKGIEALGRNPLARTSIQVGIIINIVFTVLIAIAGIVSAVILLRF